MPIQENPSKPQITDLNIKKIDQGIVDWFKIEFPIKINGREIPVIYCTSERWAKMQKEKGYRDEKGTLILPLISIRRTTPSNNKERYVAHGSETNITLVKRISTTPQGEEKQTALVGNRIPDSEYLNVADNTVYEVVQIPFPSFVNLDYDVIVWSSYISHQNLEHENIFKEFQGGRQWFYIDDYYFFGMLENITDQSNLDDFSDTEKIIKYNFKLSVQAYLIDKKDIQTYRTNVNTKLNITERSILI